MIPGGQFTTIPDVSDYLPPLDQPYNPLYQTVWGGAALNDPSQGRMVKYWQVEYSNGGINVSPQGGPIEFTLALAGWDSLEWDSDEWDEDSIDIQVDSVSLAFDPDMRPVIGWQSGSDANIYYYDGTQYVILTILGTTSSRVFLDDPRDFNTIDSDVMIAYTKNNKLYYRQERDDYEIEREIGETSKLLIKAGLNSKNRLQFELKSF